MKGPDSEISSFGWPTNKFRRTQRKVRKDGKIGEDKRWVHANSRVQDVSNSTEFIPISHLAAKQLFKSGDKG